MSAAELPDPVAFTERALSMRGALVERDGARLAALLPAGLARDLALPEELSLAALPADGATTFACGVGSPLLERLAADARRAAPWVQVAPPRDAPQGAHAPALAARVVVRNGLVDVLDAASLELVYARVTVAWAVEADDRDEGAFHVTVGPDGAEPDADAGALLDAAERAWPVATPHREALLASLSTSAERISKALEEAVVEPLARIERRHARDQARMTEYYAVLFAELGAGRRKVDAATLAARAAAIASERDARLRDLALRYAPKVTAAPSAVVFAKLPTVRVRLRVRRRKAQRELAATLPAGARALDLLACDGCGGVTARPALCDDQLHTLCERCAPQSQGRLDCPACARPKSPRAPAGPG